MDRAADGLEATGRALVGIYNAAAQALPQALERTDRALDLAERQAAALERIAAALERRGE